MNAIFHGGDSVGEVVGEVVVGEAVVGDIVVGFAPYIVAVENCLRRGSFFASSPIP